jgi:hypothetical protein
MTAQPSQHDAYADISFRPTWRSFLRHLNALQKQTLPAIAPTPLSKASIVTHHPFE